MLVTVVVTAAGCRNQFEPRSVEADTKVGLDGTNTLTSVGASGNWTWNAGKKVKFSNSPPFPIIKLNADVSLRRDGKVYAVTFCEHLPSGQTCQTTEPSNWDNRCRFYGHYWVNVHLGTPPFLWTSGTDPNLWARNCP